MARRCAAEPKAPIMPADLPTAPVAVAVPYYRVIAFVGGGGVTLAILLLLARFIGQ